MFSIHYQLICVMEAHLEMLLRCIHLYSCDFWTLGVNSYMDSQLTKPALHNVSYDIPRFVVGAPGSQHRSINSEMILNAGIAQPFDFRFMSKDGVALNLSNFTSYLIFWSSDRFEMDYGPGGYSLDSTDDIALRKNVDIIEPYEGTASVLLTNQDTEQLARAGRNNGLRWGLFLINSDNQVFAMSVTDTGDVSGTVIIKTGNVPSYEMIIG